MPALAYGLSVPKKPGSLASRPAPARRKTIFDDDSGPEDGPDGDAPEAITTLGGLSTPSAAEAPSKPAASASSAASPKKPGRVSQYGDLSSNHTAGKHAATAQAIDPSIYDYDSVYDSLHAKPAKASSGEARGPKYMDSLLAASEVRKRDQLRAKEKMLAKEREAEGDEFADKEKFVTGAYKAQQEEVRRLEAEEAKREEEEAERRRKGRGGLRQMYKSILDRDEQRHAEAVKAAEAVGKRKPDEDGPGPDEKTEADLARETGAVVNEDGQVVDKRQLLAAGLNVVAKPKAAAAKTATDFPHAHRGGAAAGLHGRGGSKAAMRERQTRMLESQLEEASKRAADDEDVQREAAERAAKSKKTEGDISSAKERYLQRKREAEAARAAGQEA
jgi:hypothetical protein